MDIDLDKLFEYVTAVLLRQNGYRVPIPGQYLEGRGGKHQIDVIGLYPYSAPFVFPIRIVAEAKCYSKGKIGIDFVRNLHSQIIDLEQTLPRMRSLNVQSGWEPNQSCSYHGALFSTIPFARDSVEYANAYCIDLFHFNNSIDGREFKSYLEELKEILEKCIEMGSPFFCKENKVDQKCISEIAHVKEYRKLDFKAKKLLLDIIEWILIKCVDGPHCVPSVHNLKPLSEELTKNKLGSIEGRGVIFDFSDEQFQKLRSATLKRFVRRSERGGNPFYPPPDEVPGPEGERIEGGPFGYISTEKMQSERKESVEVAFFFDVEGMSIETKAKIDKSAFESLSKIKAPKKVAIPVDVGCFFYGLWR